MHCTCLLLLLPPPVCNIAEYRPRTCMFSRIFRSVLVSASGLFGRVASACPSGRKGAPASELSFASCGPVVTRAFSRAVPCPSSLGVCVRCPGCSYRLVFASPVTTSPVTLAGPNTQTHTPHRVLILGLELQTLKVFRRFVEVFRVVLFVFCLGCLMYFGISSVFWQVFA